MGQRSSGDLEFAGNLFDRLASDLSEDGDVDLVGREIVIRHEFAHERRPAHFIDFVWIALVDANLSSTGIDRGVTGRLLRAAGEDGPMLGVSSVRAKCGAENARLGGRPKEHRARSVTIEERHRVVRVREAVHHVHAHDEDVLDPWVRGNQAMSGRETCRQRCTRAPDVECAGISGSELVLNNHGGGRGDEVG